MANKLPPMPANYHGWWKNAKTERIKIEPKKPCNHTSMSGETAFKLTDDGVKCMKCNLGLLGEGFEIRDGILYNNKKPAH